MSRVNGTIRPFFVGAPTRWEVESKKNGDQEMPLRSSFQYPTVLVVEEANSSPQREQGLNPAAGLQYSGC